MSKNHNFIVTSILAVVSLLMVAFIWENNLILFVALFISALLMLLIERSKQEVKVFIYCSVLGAISECIAVMFGAWTYENPNLFNIPIWLPLLWGIASTYIIRVYKFL